MHSFGIAHRDLKLENIIMSDDSDQAELKVIDFGISIILAPGQTSTDAYGTLVYVAPEVLTGKPYDKAVDLWSIGIIMYMLMYGKLPFYSQSDSDREIANQIIHDQVQLQEIETVSKEAM